MDNPLEHLRAKIDVIDNRLLELLNERAQVAKAIGEEKKRHGTAVYDASREQAVIDKIKRLNSGPLDDAAVTAIYTAVITACRELQRD